MTSGSNQRQYDCTVPPEPSDADHANSSESAQSFEDLLEPLSNSCLYRLAGWWTYEFCYGRHLRQYHQEFDKPPRPGEEFYLGQTRVTPGVGHKDHYAETYVDGTPCDITRQPRSVEVQFVCAPDQIPSAITDIKEPASCTYVVQVATNLVCKHPTLRPKKEKLQTIYCVPVPEPVVSPPSDDLESTPPATHDLSQGTFSTAADDDEEDESDIMLDPSMQQLHDIFSADLKNIKAKRGGGAASAAGAGAEEQQQQQQMFDAGGGGMRFNIGDNTMVIDGESLTVDELRKNLRTAMSGSQTPVDNVQLEELVREIQQQLGGLDKHAKPASTQDEPSAKKKPQNQGFQIHGANFATKPIPKTGTASSTSKAAGSSNSNTNTNSNSNNKKKRS